LKKAPGGVEMETKHNPISLSDAEDSVRAESSVTCVLGMFDGLEVEVLLPT
jgi:hypothetical protein